MVYINGSLGKKGVSEMFLLAEKAVARVEKTMQASNTKTGFAEKKACQNILFKIRSMEK